jgi:nitrate reductase gamma subunit
LPSATSSASEHAYHLSAVTLGAVSGVMTVVGMAILIYRRRTTGPVFTATTTNDKVMYVLLAVTIGLGLAATASNATGAAHDYRLDVAPWFRSIFYLDPHTHLIVSAPAIFQLHILSAWILLAFWPFSRLVHVFSAPIGYLTRPYIVYRSRDIARPHADGTNPPRPPERAPDPASGFSPVLAP